MLTSSETDMPMQSAANCIKIERQIRKLQGFLNIDSFIASSAYNYINDRV